MDPIHPIKCLLCYAASRVVGQTPEKVLYEVSSPSTRNPFVPLGLKLKGLRRSKWRAPLRRQDRPHGEGGVAEHMIGVLVRVDHEENRPARCGANRRVSAARPRRRRPGHDGHVLFTNGEADIGNVAFVLLAH